MRLSSIERRWRDALFAAMIPEGEARGLGRLSLGEFWAEYERAAPPLLSFGLRASVLALSVLPPLLTREPHTFEALDREAQDRFLTAAATSRVFLIRQLVTTVKAMACFAYFHDEGVRREVGS